MSTSTADIEALRADLHSYLDRAFDKVIGQLSPTLARMAYKMPAIADGHDPRNKNGLNLTPRGIEILYRVFDDNGGYNRAAKMLNISQGAAKNRKGSWLQAGGLNRVRLVLDIDSR